MLYIRMFCLAICLQGAMYCMEHPNKKSDRNNKSVENKYKRTRLPKIMAHAIKSIAIPLLEVAQKKADEKKAAKDIAAAIATLPGITGGYESDDDEYLSGESKDEDKSEDMMGNITIDDITLLTYKNITDIMEQSTGKTLLETKKATENALLRQDPNIEREKLQELLRAIEKIEHYQLEDLKRQ